MHARLALEVLRINGSPVSCFASDIPETALKRFKACRGDCKYNTVWEGLALLIAFRIWLPGLGYGAFVRCKSDNIGALVMLSKGKAKSPDMNILAREFALRPGLAEVQARLVKTHSRCHKFGSRCVIQTASTHTSSSPIKSPGCRPSEG